MFSGKYGPFAATMAITAALVTAFSVLLMKAVGKVSQWTFLADDSPPFMVTAGARALAIALIALTFIFIDKSNYTWFAGSAAVCGVLLIVLIGWFDRVRKVHICKIPQLNTDGSQKTGWFGRNKFDTLVISSESNMKQQARTRYEELGAISLCKFLSGYGRNELNNAEVVWTKEILAKISSKMTLQLIGIFLCGVMALYLAASAIEVHQRAAAEMGTQKQPP